MADGEVTAAGFYFSNNIGSAMNSEGIRRKTTNTIAFDTNSTERMTLNNSGLDLTGNLTISNTYPTINLTDTDSNDDFSIQNQNGYFVIRDATDGVDRFLIDSAGTATVAGNLDVGAGIDVTGEITATSHLDMPDDAIIKLGTGDDLQIYHDGTTNQIISGTGADIRIGTSGEAYALFKNNGAVELYYDNTKRLETVSDGVKIPGQLKLDDNYKVNLGSSQDLQIYHDGTNSFLANSTGYLLISSVGDSVLRSNANVELQPASGESGVKVIANGAVELYYDASKKLETDSLGITLTGRMILGDSSGVNDHRIKFGDSGDLQIYHDGSNSYIKNIGTGNLYIDGDTDDLVLQAGDDVRIQTQGNEDAINCVGNGAVELYFDNVKQVQTTANGVGFVNNCTFSDDKKIQLGNSNDLQIYHNGTTSIIDSTTTNLDIQSSNTINIKAADESSVVAHANGAVELYFDGTKQCETNSGGMNWADGKRAYFGNSSDLQIYHDGNHSFINDSGTGLLKILTSGFQVRNAADSETLIYAVQDGAVNLYHNNSKKFETTSGGIAVTGSVIPTGNVNLSDSSNSNNNRFIAGTSDDLQIYHDGTNSVLDNNTGNLYINSSGDIYLAPNNNEAGLYVRANGAVELYHDGTKQCETNSGGMNWADGKRAYFGNSSDLQIYHDGSNSRVHDSGTGVLCISGNQVLIQNAAQSEQMAKFVENGQAELYYDNSKKFETTASGVNIGGNLSSNPFDFLRFGASLYGAADIAPHNAGSHTVSLSFRTDSTADTTINPTEKMRISANGSIGAPSGSNIYNASDSRLKQNITTLDKGLSAINSLRPVSFNWIDGFCDEEKDTLYGFIAQEVETIDTNLINKFGSDGVVNFGTTTIKNALTVNEKFIIPMLVKAVQELTAKVTALELL